MIKTLLILVALLMALCFSKPMEPLTRYNVVLVHGAADGVSNGFACNDNAAKNIPFTMYKAHRDSSSRPWQIGEAVGMIGSYENSDKLTNWLDTRIFEDTITSGSNYIYIQRSFTKPAGSPKDNGHEIGNAKWQCGERRSLIEEAQEVKAKGRDSLKEYRNDVKLRDKLPPSRNILIAHSMGGVASREYVQGDNYNEDVDKVITLDSPHEGTGSLNLLLDMNNWPLRTYKAVGNVILLSALWLGLSEDISNIKAALYGLITSSLFAGIDYGVGQGVLANLKGFDYKPDDPLVDYINTNSNNSNNGVKKLQGLPYRESLPMMRLLGGKNSMTFTDPNEGWRQPLSFFIPNGLTAAFANVITHMSGNETNAANFVNSVTGFTIGLFGGVTVQEHGTALVPESSSMAKSTDALNDFRTDVRRVQYDAAINANEKNGLSSTATDLTILASSILAVDIAIGYFFPNEAKIIKVALGVAGAVMLGQGLILPIIVGADDLKLSHEAPALSKYQSQWKASPNTYSKILGGQGSYEPYLMEEFLYEKPFANIRVISKYSNDWKDQNKDTLGLFGKDSSGKDVSLGVTVNFEGSNPLAFKSSSDWEQVGAKKVRWELATGVSGEKVPIRHADRYPMPAFMVDKFIEKYEFEVDDLMPHRLRQIRINFNFNEDIAWECDINKAETDGKACAVYRRTPAGPDWVKIGDEKHPVDRNGIFVFEPRKYYNGVGLGAIQKDNQNTVTISTVNKMGLANSQRFYYMFKATADLLEPTWPLRNIKVSRIEDFTAYVSTLAYQNISSIGGTECVILDDSSPSCKHQPYNMSGPLIDGNGYLLKSLHNYNNYSDSADWKYIWKLEIETGDTSDASKSSVSDMFVPFVLDKTAPIAGLAAEKDVVNLDSAAILARFETNEPLKFAAFFLKNTSGETIAVAKYSDIIAPNFGVRLPEFKDIRTRENMESLPDGRYMIAAYAFDGSVASKEQYDMLNKVARSDTTVFELFSNGTVKYAGMNAGKDTATIIVDSHAPEFEITLSGLVMNKDSLLKIRLDVSDRNGKSAAVAKFSILFADTSVADTLRIGDTLTLKNGIGGKTWKEQESMLIQDGDYRVFVNVWDEAGNMSQKKYDGILRVDRLPPTIVEAYSSQMVYRDSTNDYTAALHVEQHDKENLLSGMRCSYRINGREWQSIPDTLPKKAGRQVLEFGMGRKIVGSEHGLRYLEAGCVDWAGNFASVLDIFFVGVPSPVITYPIDILSNDPVIAIRGIAPKLSSNDLPASYMLEWRKEGDALWQTKGVDVGYGKRRSDSVPYISNGIQPSSGDLGFLDMESLATGTYELRLSVRDCDACEWRSDSAAFYHLAPLNADVARDSLHFAASAGSFDLEKDSILSISLKVKGAANADYSVSLYARDSKGALFETRAKSLTIAPYYGKPAAFEQNGAWFWSEEDNVYNLRWKGLPEGKNIAVHYAKGALDESVCGTGCSKIDTLLASDEDMHASAQAAGFGTPYEVRKPKGLNGAMLFSGDSGQVQFSSRNPLWLQFKNIENIADSTAFPVHIGKGGSTLEIMASFLGGFQANPDFYGLYYEWNGISSAGRYPQGDTAYFYAEAVENTNGGGSVLRDSIKVEIKKPSLAVKASSVTLDDFNVVNDNGNTAILGNKTAYYGILWRDAKVSAYVRKADGTLVKALFKDKEHAALRSENNYMLSWNGIDESEHLVMEEGNYYFEIVATESGAPETPQTSVLRLDFRISFAPGVKYVYDEPGKPSLLSLEHAISFRKDYWRYTPVADYLVQAKASGKTLPDSLRKPNVKWDASGKQSIYGYPPQRFSLAVKRQRETLPLVIVAVAHLDIIQQGCSYGNIFHRPTLDTLYVYDKVTFSSTTLSNTIELHFDANGYGENGSGLDHSGFGKNKIYLYAFLQKHAERLSTGSLRNLIEGGMYVWKDTINLPATGGGGGNEAVLGGFYGAKKDTNCLPSESTKDSEETFCVYNIDSTGKRMTTNNYDPNKNLFNAVISPKNSNYYSGWGEIHNNCWVQDDERYQDLNIKINLTIPNEYWNAEYGYDNLVNRTIRLDQTNQTMYGEDGYLRQVKDSTDIKTFFDSKDWNENYTYGMLTPFEEHRFPFVPVDKVPSNNAFTFPDEDSNHKYSSYYQAKFFNQKSNDILFQAKIKGQYRNRTTSVYDSTLFDSNKDTDNLKTKLFQHGKVDIYVSMNDSSSVFDKYKVDISYPASKNWMDSAVVTQYKCPFYTDNSWLTPSASVTECRKFYENSVSYGEAIKCDTSFSFQYSKYDSTRKEFYYKTNCNPPASPNLKVKYTPKIKNTSDTSLYGFRGDTLYIKASDWNSVSALRHLDSARGWDSYPKIDSSITLQSKKFFNDPWVKEFKLDSAKVLLLDSNNHTHFKAKVEGSNIELSAKNPPDSLRPAEFIAVKGSIPENSSWKLSYVNLGDLHKLASGRSAGSLHEWFNVNRLQGNTSILLQWGGDGAMLNIRKLDLDIGASVNSKSDNKSTVVSSLFGEVSVNFPPGSIRDSSNNKVDTIVTVRTANARDYGFETSSGSALLGPVVEVLPSMKFSEANGLPRIKAHIARGELNGLSPDRVRLYKIDVKNSKFVELQNTLIGFDVADSVVLECKPENYENCGGYSNNNWSYLLISAETRTFSAFAILDKDVAEQSNIESDIVPDKPLPTEIVCEIPEGSLWLGLDNGYLELPQWCNQPAMGMLQLRQGGSVIAEARQNTADTLRWDGRTGINKIAHGDYASRYIAIGATGQEMQTIGPVIYTDTLKPVISNWSVEESSVVLDREFKIQAKVHDELSGIGSIRLNWFLSEAISGTVYLNADKDGNVNYELYIPRNQLAQCLGCKLNISLRVEDKGHNYAVEEWRSGSLWPYPAELALWYPALEGAGKTAKEYIGTGHDLDLLMQTPWLSASGVYFDEKGRDKALGKGEVQLGNADTYTLEAWVNPGYMTTSAWHRILGFSLASGKNVELQTNGSDVRLLDGFESWSVPALSLPKTWTHLVVAVNANYARFYADGKLAGVVAAVSSERSWSGSFSLGTESGIPSFAGHIMQVRFYKRALEAEEALALFNGIDLGEGSHTEIALAGELDGKAAGMERSFSCAVPGSSYWGTPKESSLIWRVWASQAASYKVFLYARSAQPGEKNLKAGSFGGAMHSGVVSLESVWRPVVLQGVALPLKAGFNDLELRLPAGTDIAGIAISGNSGLQASQISWKSENVAAASSTAVAQVRFEGDPDPSMLRPRIRLRNAGNATIYGPKVRYYFRGEDPSQVQASKFYPQDGTLVVRQEGNNLGYAEWSFPETTALPSGQLLFWGEGPHFGLHNTNYVPWVTKDDPSFAEGGSNSFVDAPRIVVLDADNKVLSGSCFENEEGLISVPVVQVLARDSRFGDNQASQLYIKLENIGQVPIRDYEVRYSFYVPGSIVPVLDIYDMQGLSASLKALGSGRWQAIIKGAASLGPGISWANPAQFALHLPNWQSGWNAGDDPSYKGISAEWAVAKGIEVFDASGNRIYGREPSWATEIANSSSSGSSASSIRVRVMAKESKAYENNASAPRFYVENLSTENISGFEVRYWLSVSPGKELGYQIYNNTQFSASVVKENATLYSGRFAYTGSPLAPGAKTEWGNGLEFSVFHTDWSAWDKDSDFSHKDLGLDFAEARYIAVYDNAGNLVWGAEPVIAEEINNPAIGIVRLPDGLLLSLQETSDLRLDLVNAAGMPQKFLHQGILGVGEHIIPVNWSNVDIARTYLVVRLNGHIISSKILSKL